jgi:mono/diheme cytochrome c family protein
MRLRLTLLFLCLSLLSARDAAAASLCARVKAGPDAWAERSVDALVRAALAAYEDEDALPRYRLVLGRIAHTLERCGLSRDEGFVERRREFVEYVGAASLDLLPDHELGFVVPDEQYFGETRDLVRIPDFLTTRAFLRAVSRYETLARAKSYLRRLNEERPPGEKLVFFSYTSRHLGTPDSPESYGRLLIVVPGDPSRGEPDKWVQFGVPDAGARGASVRNVSVVSVTAGGGGTSNVYFKDFYRIYRRDGSFSIRGRWELGYGDDNCAQCHKSGVLPIFPEEGSVAADELPAVDEVNERFITYGPARFDPYLDVTKFGPGLGAQGPPVPADGAEASTVSRLMSCAVCHRPGRMGSLSWPMDKTIVSSFVKGGRMPLGATLTEPERAQLYRSLVREYFSTDGARPGTLKSWLLGRLR